MRSPHGWTRTGHSVSADGLPVTTSGVVIRHHGKVTRTGRTTRYPMRRLKMNASGHAMKPFRAALVRCRPCCPGAMRHSTGRMRAVSACRGMERQAHRGGCKGLRTCLPVRRSPTCRKSTAVPGWASGARECCHASTERTARRT